MKRPPRLIIALLAPFVLVWSATAFATGSCQNGKTLYNKTNANVTTACSNSNCHGTNVNKKNIENAAGNPSAIDMALDGNGSNAEMLALDLRNNLPLNASDIDDLATYIFFATIPQACPPMVNATPTTVSFGSVNAGSQSATTQTVTFTNTGGAATGLSYSNSNSTDFLVSAGSPACGASLAAGASCRVNIAFKPSSAGSKTGTYTMSGTNVEVSVTMDGTGISATPNVQASPTSAAFGSVQVGNTSSTTTITVTNSGGGDATGVALSNPNSAEFLVTGDNCAARRSPRTAAPASSTSRTSRPRPAPTTSRSPSATRAGPLRWR